MRSPFFSFPFTMVILNQVDMIQHLGCEVMENGAGEGVLVFRGVFRLEPVEPPHSNDRYFMVDPVFKDYKWIRLLRPNDETSRIPEGKERDDLLWGPRPSKKSPPLQKPERYAIRNVRKDNRPAALVLIRPLREEETMPEGQENPDMIVAAINQKMRTSLALDRTYHPRNSMLEGKIDKVIEVGNENNTLLPVPSVNMLGLTVNCKLWVKVIPVIMIEFSPVPNPKFGENLFCWRDVGKLEDLWDEKNPEKNPLRGTFNEVSGEFGMQNFYHELYYACDFIYRRISSDETGEKPTYIVQGNKRAKLPPNIYYDVLAWVKTKGTDNSRLLNEKDGRRISHEKYMGFPSVDGSGFYAPRTHLQRTVWCNMFY